MPRLPTDNRWIRTLLVTLFALVILRMLGWGSPVVEVVVELRSQAGADGEIFYSSKTTEGYSPDRRVRFTIKPDGGWHTYRIGVPETGGLDRVRIDPGSSAGPIEIRRVAVETQQGVVELRDAQLASGKGMLNDLSAENSGRTGLRFFAHSPDPYIDFKLPSGAGVTTVSGQLRVWLAIAAEAGLLWLILGEALWPRVVRPLVSRVTAGKTLGRWTVYVSDPDVLVVPPPALIFFLITLASAALYVAVGLNQSSTGIWEEMYPVKPVAQSVDLGTPRHVRSDEWNTQTPWVLNQVERGESDQNQNIGGDKAPLLAAVPVRNLWAVAQGEFYGFHLFDLATGFSWWWAYKTFGLLLSFFWLFLLLTRGDTLSSLLGATWVYASSFTQWWLSSSLPELMIAFALATIGAIYLMFARRRIFIGAGALLIAYAVLNLMLHLYPPFILPMAYLGAAILAGLLLEPGRLDQLKAQRLVRLYCFSATLLTLALIGGVYLVDAMPAMKAMAQTSYPGHRVSLSGDFPVTRLFYGFFEVFRFGETHVPLPPTNASEASSFVVLLPLLLFAMPLAAFARKKNGLLIALTAYGFVVGLWICVPLPTLLQSSMQAIGWSWSPPSRSVLGFGLASIVGTTAFFSRVRLRNIEVRSVAARGAIAILSIFCLLGFGWMLHGIDPSFFNKPVVLGGTAAAGLIAIGVLFGRASLFAGGLAAIVIPPLTVNPLVSGISAIEEKPVLVAAKNQGNGAGDRWAVVGSFVFSQGLKAKGLDVVTGSEVIPNRNTISILDPQGRYENIWNRYAHVMIRSDPGRLRPTYELLGPDLYIIGLDVCGADLPKLGVTRIAYTVAVSPRDLQCLQPLAAPTDSGVRLFRLSKPTGGGVTSSTSAGESASPAGALRDGGSPKSSRSK